MSIVFTHLLFVPLYVYGTIHEHMVWINPKGDSVGEQSLENVKTDFITLNWDLKLKD